LIGKIIFLSLLFLPLCLTPVFAYIPNDSIYFDGLDEGNYILKGTNGITNQENPSYQLNGINDYMILNSNLPEKLNEFSISVWIKPIYKVGVPSTLSIVSEPNAFELSLNNDKVDRNIVKFSIYDGIKWHIVQSKSSILEQWTHISATYSGNEIKIFVNGIQEDSQKIDGDYSLTHNAGGVSTQHSYDHISSKSNVIVGAFSFLVRSDDSIKNNFSGQIDDVILYETVISKEHISTLYNNDRIFHETLSKKIEIVTEKQVGVANLYGFFIDPDNSNDQKIETLASEGYKVPKTFSAIHSSSISETNDNSKKSISTQITNPDNQTTEILKDEEQPKIETSKPFVGSKSTTTICHIPSSDINSAYTITISSSFVNLHLDHGDTIGKCVG
jgi:hypothetical protein